MAEGEVGPGVVGMVVKDWEAMAVVAWVVGLEGDWVVGWVVMVGGKPASIKVRGIAWQVAART